MRIWLQSIAPTTFANAGVPDRSANPAPTACSSSACGKEITLLKLFHILCATRCMTLCTVAFGTLNTLDTTRYDSPWASQYVYIRTSSSFPQPWSCPLSRSLCRLFMARLDRRKSCHTSAPSSRHMRRMGTVASTLQYIGGRSAWRNTKDLCSNHFNI